MTIEIHDHENSTEAAFLNKHLAEFNTTQGFVANAKPLTLVFRDPQGEIVAGLSGSTSWNWLYTRLLWVCEAQRRSGLGSELIQAAEVEARGETYSPPLVSTMNRNLIAEFQRRLGVGPK